MHRSGADSNLAALHAGSTLPGHVLDVIVLTADAGLLATLREASPPEHALWHAQTADAAVDLLVGGRCGILIADLSALRSDAAAFFDRLHAQFPELVLMATGRREEEGVVAALVSSGLIYRLLHKPVSPARAGLFVTAATRRYYELRSAEPAGQTASRTIAARPHLNKIIVGSAILAIAIVAFVLWRSASDEETSVAVESSGVSAAVTGDQIATLLGRAQIAYARDDLAEPRGDNALEHFRAVLELQPDHADARAGVLRVANALEGRVTAALQERNAPKAVSALAALRRAQPDYPRLDMLQAQLIALSRSASAMPPAATKRETPAQNASPAVRAAADLPATTESREAPRVQGSAARSVALSDADETVGRRVVEAKSRTPSEDALQAVAQLRERGDLLEPVQANAYDALIELRAAFPDAEEIRAEEQRLAFALLEQTRTALAAGNLNVAALLLERTETLVPEMATTRALQQQLESAQRERAFAANVVQAAALKRTREVAAAYPRDAERSGVEGWVDVEFTIAADGSTQDFVVRDALHRDVFERAAIDSVRRWRFEPIKRDGAAVAQRAILRVRFALQ